MSYARNRQRATPQTPPTFIVSKVAVALVRAGVLRQADRSLRACSARGINVAERR